MKNLATIILSLFVSTLLADDLQTTKQHLLAEAQTKQALVERIRAANFQLTDNQRLYDVTYYSLNLTPDVQTEILYGDVTMRAQSLQDGLAAAELDFLTGMAIDSVFFGGNPATYTHTNDILAIDFAAPVNANEFFDVRVVYHGRPDQTGFGAFGFDSHNGQPIVWTLSEPFGARNWWPCKDAPIDKADSVDIRVTVRADLVVASNGTLKSVTSAGNQKTYWWHEGYPITTYLVSLAIHPYHVSTDWYVTAQNDSMPVQFYIYPDDAAGARPENAKTVSMIKTFAGLFGEYPFLQEKYGHAQFPWGGGMEHQTITSLGGFTEGLIAHELAHQWWGDMVTCADFHHIWVNEGFATYSEALWWEANYGETALHQDMSYNAYLGEETVYVEDPTTDDIFNYATTYAKGAWVLHILRHVVGDENFFTILKTYYNEFKFKTATTEQFRDLCERVSGQELDTFFYQWIYQGGAPFYEYLWWSQPAANANEWQVNVIIRQVQNSVPVFEMPIDIGVVTAAGETTVVLQNNQRVQDFSFIVQGEPIDVLFDQNNWILRMVDKITQPVLSVQAIAITNADGLPQEVFAPGEQGRLTFAVKNDGTKGTAISALLSSDDPSVSITSGQVPVGDLSSGQEFESTAAPMLFEIAGDAPSHLATLRLRFQHQDGVSEPYDFQIPIGEPTLLIVDDDNGADYEKYYQSSALQKGEYASNWPVSILGVPTLENLREFDYVLWFTGDDTTTSLTGAEQALLTNYLAGGGSLLLTGQTIGYDLVEKGNVQDSLFYHNVLFADYDAEILSGVSVVGAPGDPVGNRLTARFDDMGSGAGNQNFLHAAYPVAPATSSFLYLPGQKSAGIRYADAATGAKLVYLAFGLEGIEGPKETSAADILQSALDWFADIDTSTPGDGSETPDIFVLRQNYPNPFNPATTVMFYNPEKTGVSVAVYNSLGQHVRQIFSGVMNAGWHTFAWDGSDDNNRPSASGVYFMQVAQQGENKFAPKSVKMLKLD